MFEYACGESSELTEAASAIGVNSIRLSRTTLDLSEPTHVAQVQGQVQACPGCDIWLSLPCTDYCPWQDMNVHVHGPSFEKKLQKRRKNSRGMLQQALGVLETALEQYGRVAVEWPTSSGWWKQPEWLAFEQKHKLHKVNFHGCSVGVRGKHLPIKKPWTVATNDLRLVQFLSQCQCDGTHEHEPAEGSQTRQTESYPPELASTIVEALYPQRFHRHVPALVTKNLSKREWKSDPLGVAAVRKEADGLRANNTWDDDSVRLLSDLRSAARREQRKVKIAELLTLCGIKFFELPQQQWKYKGRICYRGDSIFDAHGNHVLFEETATTPTSLVALNLALFFGCRDGNQVSLADAVQAFLQADLSEAGEPDTWVILPEELWLESWRAKFEPGSKIVVRLRKSLYGHPLAGKLWQRHLSAVLSSLGGVELDLFPSNFLFQVGDQVLLLNIYVDDLTLSGPKHLHQEFWSKLRAHVKLEPEIVIQDSNARILGRGHRITSNDNFTTLTLDMTSFAEQVVDAYCDLARYPKDKLRKVNTPCLPESLATDEDLAKTGELNSVAAKVLMKALWLGRLARPDLCFIIGRLASRVSQWSRWEDRQLLRMISYLHWTSDFCLSASVAHGATPQLHIYTDSDFGSCPHTAKSTSGVLMQVATGEHRFPVWWTSKRQTSVARSTPEAEAIAMASAMFGEALNIQVLLEHLLGHAVDVVFHQDNETLLKVLVAGYSAKLRHCNRVHRINIASMSEQLAEPHISARYCKSEDQVSNGLTKIIAPAEWPRTLEQFGLQSSGAGLHPDAACAAIDVTLPAEIFASESPKSPTAQHLVQLLALLPHDRDSRGIDPNASHVFAAGAFVQGGVYGLRKQTVRFKLSVSMICRFFKHYMPAHTFTSVILQQGAVTSPHRDSHNAEGSRNLLVSLTPANGPILWVEDPEGDTKCPDSRYSSLGTLLSNPARFDPRTLHCTIVSHGNAVHRIVAVAFTIRQPERLSAPGRKVLRELGFNLPVSS